MFIIYLNERVELNPCKGGPTEWRKTAKMGVEFEADVPLAIAKVEREAQETTNFQDIVVEQIPMFSYI
jgi:hypothetical protein